MYNGLYGYGYGYGMFFDPTYFLILIGVVLSLIASARVKSTYAKYQKVRSRSNMTGAMTAERLLRANGINDVRIEHVAGNLTDHYDPRSKVLRLSDSVYGSTSVAAISVAAHEVGHCIQHARGYAPLKIRTALVPVANFGSGISWILILAGIFFGGFSWLIDLGIIFFSAAVLFQIVTLPVEFNASSRALTALSDTGILYQEEIGKGRKVLRAAALTYVASAAAAILQLLRLVLLFGNRSRD
ncbi:MAG: zinc metallopeptidase [Lachnospiraceae bacterium]|nr:zinc metallopeptidase [Lachnospiraceae bacterium]